MKKLFAGAKYLVKVTTHTLRYWYKKTIFTSQNWFKKNNAKSGLDFSPQNVEQKISMVFHAYHLELAKQIFVWIEEFASKSSLPVHLIVTTPAENFDEIGILAKNSQYQSEVVVVENHGRDIWPFLQVCQSGRLANSALVLKIHTKAPRTLGTKTLLNVDSIHELLEPALIEGLLKQAEENPYFVATYTKYVGKTSSWGRNVNKYFRLLRRLQLEPLPKKLRFPAGTIFWTTGKYSELVGNIAISREDFLGEPSPDDGATEHVLERLFGMLAKDNGGVIPLEKLLTGGTHENRNLRNERDST